MSDEQADVHLQGGETCTEDENLERQHFQKVMESFLSYKDYSSKKLARVKENYCKLPRQHQEMLPGFLPHLENIGECIDTNHKFLCSIANSTGQMFENEDNNVQAIKQDDGTNRRQGGVVTQFEMDKVITTLRQFVRDWSDEGQEERAVCYQPILDELKHLFPPTECSVQEVSVLIPGAGLARLMFEVAQLGYQCQGNEWSLYMLFASNYILNRCSGQYHTTIHPYVHQWCNNRSSTDQVRPIRIPDVDPSSISHDLNFSMAAGDFLQVYVEEETWDCVVTCFFIDTAHNVIAYIENIWKILKPGAYWINLGPLLYHFADIPNELSLELTYQDIRRIMTEDFQFELVKEENISSGYIENKRSMLKMTYQNTFFVARKPLNKTSKIIE